MYGVLIEEGLLGLRTPSSQLRIIFCSDHALVRVCFVVSVSFLFVVFLVGSQGHSVEV